MSGKGKGKGKNISSSCLSYDDMPSQKGPLSVGTFWMCKWRDGVYHECEIIERTPQEEDPSLFSYYIHYADFNKRLDEWISDISQFKPTGKGSVKLSPAEKKRKREAQSLKNDEEQAEKEHEEVTKVKNVDTIQLGKWTCDAWYFSPYPAEVTKNRKLFICEFCLKYMKTKKTLFRHIQKCTYLTPPGNEVYRCGPHSFFEVNGKKNRIYCQNLCLLAKLFLDHKTLYYDVDPFLFYILTESDDKGCHIVGYFSKEINSPDNYNLACILTLPQFQRKGFGNLLISFSYELSKLDSLTGSPEKPLSDLGLLSYRSYWSQVILELLDNHRGNLSISDITTETCIKTEDILGTLQSLGLIRYYKGCHVLSVAPSLIQTHLKTRPGALKIHPECIKLA